MSEEEVKLMINTVLQNIIQQLEMRRKEIDRFASMTPQSAFALGETKKAIERALEKFEIQDFS